MCMYVTEVPTSARAGLVWPCWKRLFYHRRRAIVETYYQGYCVPDDGWLFPTERSSCRDWHYELRVVGNVIHAFVGKGYSGYWEAWAIGVTAFGDGVLVARALFVPHVAREADRKLALRAESLLSRIADGHYGRRELFELHPQLRYAVTGKR